MSYTEINHSKGMRYGGMPHDEILLKLEETDPLLVGGRSDDPFYDVEDNYDDYARSEIIDWAPDATYLESDRPRRDPTLSRTMLNLRHAGGRGPNDHRGPQHPEMFLGFTGNDPRGMDVTNPRFDEMRAHAKARTLEKVPRMGKNVGHGDLVEADRPWTGMSMEYDKKEMQRRMHQHMRWFTAQKEVSTAPGGNIVADERYSTRQRASLVGNGDEGLYDSDRAVVQFRGQGSAYDPVRGAEGQGPRRVDRRAAAETAPWRLTTGEADLAVERYTAGGRGGRGTIGPNAVGGALKGATQADAAFGQQARAASTNRRVLAASMSAAAERRRARARAAGGDAAHGVSAEVMRTGASAPQLARDIAAAARQGVHDQAARGPGVVGDGEGGTIAAGAGLGAPPGDRQAALYGARTDHQASTHERLANASAMVRGLREGTAAGRRTAKGMAVATGDLGTATGDQGGQVRGLRGGTAAGYRAAKGMAVAMGNLGTATGDAAPGGMPGGGLAPGTDLRAAIDAIKTPLKRAAAAEGLVVHHYGLGAPGRPHDRVESAAAGGFASSGESREGRREGRSKAPEFRSHTQVPAALGASANRTFGSVGERAGPHTGGLSVGTKSLRPSSLADGGDELMSGRGFDGLGEMDDGAGGYGVSDAYSGADAFGESAFASAIGVRA